MQIDQIKSDLVAAMKAGDRVRTSTLRMLISELNYKQIELLRELTDEDAAGVVRREAKKRREAIESFRAGGRLEQAEAEEQELTMLLGYLPKEMSEEEVRRELMTLDLPTDFGAAMKMAAPAFRGRADGGLVARLVKEMVNK